MPKGQIKDIRGQRFGRLVVIDEEPIRKPVKGGTEISWRCACDCGATTVVKRGNLTNGATTSCGCFRKEQSVARHLIHGARRRLPDGSRSIPEYNSWQQMLRRCHVPSDRGYSNYGGRGITVCERWRSSFTAFYEDMGPRPEGRNSIERLDNDGPYEPGNCVWADQMTQSSNTRWNRWITAAGKTQTLSQWSRETGLSTSRICQRIDLYGWSAEEALELPPFARPKKVS